MKKRIISLILVIAIILNFNITALAAGGATLTSTLPSDGNLKAGDTFTVTLTVPPVSGFASLHLGMHFEKSVLEVTSLSLPDKVGGYAAVITDVDEANVAGAFAVSFAQAQNISTTDTMVLSVDFKVKDGATPNNYPKLVEVEDDDYDFTDEDDVPLTTVPALNTKTISATILKAPIASVTIADLDAPVKGAAPDTSVTVTPSSLAADVKWFDGATPVTGNFAASTAYTVKIKLTASGGDNFAETVTAGDYTVTRNSDTELLLTKTFPKTNDKDTPVCVAPTGVTAPFGSALSTITLTNPTGNTTGKWYWMDNTQKVGNVKDNPHTYKAKFVPTDAANFSTVENIDVTVNATKVVLGAGSPIMIPIEETYTGSAIEPTPKIMTELYGDELVLNQDYKITKYENNTSVGTGKISIAPLPNGNYDFTGGSYNFTIKAGTSSISITGDPSKPYDGNVVADPAVNKSGSTGAVSYTYYTDAACTTKTTTASGAASDGAAPKNAGDYWVQATVAADSNYGSATSAPKKFTISQKALTDSMITLGTQKTYNGTEQGVALSSDSIKDGTVPLIGAGKDYSIVRGNKATDVGDNTLVIKGEGNYTGEARATWSLVAKEVTITPDAKSKTYGAAEPELTYSTDLTAGSALETAFNTAKSGALSYTGTDVGAYPITLGSLAAGSNFTLKIVTPAVKFTINQATPSITATSPRQLVKNDVEVDITGWASFNNTDSSAKLTYTLEGAPAGITLTADNKLKAANDASTVSTFNIKVNAAATTNFAAPTEKVIVVNVVTKADAGVSITGAPTSKTYGDADFTLTATKTAPDGGTWSWNSSNPAILEIVSGADTATPTIKVKKADTTGATLTVTYTSSTHYGSSSAAITVAQKEVTVAAGDYKVSKEYDGTTGIGTSSGALSVSGILTGDAVVVTTAPVAYTDANVGGQSTMDANITLVGSDKDNYKVKGGATTISVPCEITAKDVKLTGGINATDRSYVKDNKTVALTKGTLTFTGLVGSETLDVNIPATGTISDAKVGAYNVTYSGVTLADGTGKASNYKLVSPLPPVTVNITKATAPAPADIPVSQKYTVTTGEKAIGTVMPADAGALTYTKGAESKTGSVTVTSWAVDTTGKVTYTLSGGAAGDTVTLPVTIGSDNYADATVNVVITLTAKDDQATLTLTGGTTVVYGQTLQLGTSGGSGTGAVTYAVTNGTGEATIDATGKLTPVKVGTVKVKATKAEDANYNAITSAEVEITITRATPTGAPKYTAITTSGKTLADAGLTTAGSTLNPNAGTLVWVDNADNVLLDTTAVAANTTYKWLFTPTDANYTTLTGFIELYHKSSSGGGGWYYTYYTIKATAGTNGSISPSGWTSVRHGWDQTFTITPDKGYAVAKVLVDGKSVGAVKSYTFKNVTKDHTIEAIFMKSNGNPQTGVFVDVAEGSYYEEAIDWAVEKGITNGVSSNMFAPNDPCTRAQIVTFLWRAAGSPAPKSMSSFTDVPADAFYAKAVAWAVENGITSGTGESKFSPNATCTRAQAVTFLYRASGSPAVSGKAEFSDVSTTAFYADAVAWAAKKGITTGIGGGLFGSDNDCTRGQIVTFLWRAMAE